MIRVAMITRSTLYTIHGGDTVQVTQTARQLSEMGVKVDVILTDAQIDYNKYDLLHFFNIIRPADILHHIKRSGKRFVISTILIDYSEYDKFYRKGIAGILFRFLPADHIEYIKTVSRWLLGKDRLMSMSYLWKGQRRSIREVIRKAGMLLPNSDLEYKRIKEKYHGEADHLVVPNGIDTALFRFDGSVEKDPLLVICAARIEGIKNQFNLIKALNGTKYTLLLIGSPTPNQLSYYAACRELAQKNISFIAEVSQEELLKYYRRAKTHILPSWFETTGLSSLEAAAMGCNVIITDRGDAKEYFGSAAFYCDPASPASILTAVEKTSMAHNDGSLQQKILEKYNWQRAAEITLSAYHKITGIA
jgi:glycosyltransferase involved in cell wall biosynthesis